MQIRYLAPKRPTVSHVTAKLPFGEIQMYGDQKRFPSPSPKQTIGSDMHHELQTVAMPVNESDLVAAAAASLVMADRAAT